MTEQQAESEQGLTSPSPEKSLTTLEECEQALELSRQEAAERWEALMRARAELDNERKRAAREIEKAHKFSLTQLLTALLPVKDSLELGLAAFEAAPDKADTSALQYGMQLTLTTLDTILNDFGVESIEPQGQPFNPEYHEVMYVEPVSDVPPNTVIEVQQKGYLLNGRIVRPARVTIASAPQASES